MDPSPLITLPFGLAVAWLVGQAYYPLMLRAVTAPEPAPDPEPERDPDWCHTHGKHKDDEE